MNMTVRTRVLPLLVHINVRTAKERISYHVPVNVNHESLPSSQLELSNRIAVNGTTASSAMTTARRRFWPYNTTEPAHGAPTLDTETLCILLG
jgi:hypothetical protein